MGLINRWKAGKRETHFCALEEQRQVRMGNDQTHLRGERPLTGNGLGRTGVG